MVRTLVLPVVGAALAGCVGVAGSRGQAGLLPAQVEMGGARPGAVEVRVAGQGERGARLWLPSGRAPRSMVVFLHGAVFRHPRSGRRIDGEEQTRTLLDCLVVPALSKLDPIVVLPWSDEGIWWSADDTRYVLGLVRAAARRWPEASSRRVIAGYSNGGIGAWYFARLYPDYFTGAVAIASNATIVGPSGLPIFAIHGTEDEIFPIAPLRRAIAEQTRRGGLVFLLERREGSHVRPCEYLPELALAGRWLEPAPPGAPAAP